MNLRISSSTVEGVYQGSKYLKYQVLCDPIELSQLFEILETFWIYPLTGIVDGTPIDPQGFIQEYAAWIEGLKQGLIPSDAALRKLLACALTAELEALWRQEVPNHRFLIKMSKPVIQIQAHFFTYSSIDGVFRPMTMGVGSIFWGLQFGFPQIYQDPKTMEFFEVDASPNRELFQKIRQWVRDATRATPFIVDGKRINAPIRLGKNCFSWIHTHPQMVQQKIGVYAS